jgi:acetone carboxylase alpha subunit
MNSDWGLMGGYPSAPGYRFEDPKTGLKQRIAEGKSLPLGQDRDPRDCEFEKHLEPGAIVKRDKQCITTEEMFDNGDLYLNYLRGGPGLGDPLDREIEAIEDDLNQNFILEEFAIKIYGAVFTKDEEGVYTVDADKTKARQAEIRKERIARGQPVREWMKGERQNIIDKKASLAVQQMFASSFYISPTFLAEFKEFWDLPESWELPEEELGTPMYGARITMEIGDLPDVTPVVMVEE